VQTLVRIYNRHSFLGRCQDLEFGIYGRLYQAGRSSWGTAGMGGNGQFNRLAALDSVADREGPWRHTLTEDQNLGLRLIGAGWISRAEPRVGVDQQGLNNLRRLLRQRTRWAQGNLQAMRLFGVVRRAPVSGVAKFDLTFLLLLPVLQLFISANALLSLLVFVVFGVPFWGGSLWLLFLFYGLGFGSSVLGLVCQAPRITPLAVLRAALLSVPYTAYAWLTVPALVRAVYRQATARSGWVKTAREPLEHPLA
jgi:cellulose synthase/poly-beta-1,6-N-acetylglucosamine synthase-like glycosyltransferase